MRQKIFTSLCALIVISLTGCSNNLTVGAKDFKDKSKPFQTPYQSEKSLVTMVVLDTANDQVDIPEGDSYVFWKEGRYAYAKDTVRPKALIPSAGVKLSEITNPVDLSKPLADQEQYCEVADDECITCKPVTTEKHCINPETNKFQYEIIYNVKKECADGDCP
jgi:hypothetical protein